MTQSSELFRFMTLSPAQSNAQNITTVRLLEKNDTVVNDALKNAGILNADKSKVLPAAKAYIKSPLFYAGFSQLTPVMQSFVSWLRVQKKVPGTSAVVAQVTQIYPQGIKAMVASPEFLADRMNVILSLIVASIVPDGMATIRPQLLETFKIFSALISLAPHPDSSTNFELLMRRTVLLPDSIFPITYDNSLAQKKLQDAKDNIKNIEAQNQATIDALTNQLNLNRTASSDLISARTQHINLLRKQTNIAVTSAGGNASAAGAPVISKANSSFLPPEIVAKISPATKAVLAKYSIDTDLIDVNEARVAINEQNKILTNQLLSFQNRNTQVTLVGQTLLPANTPRLYLASSLLSVLGRGTPGPCALGSTPDEEDLATDKWNTRGIIPVLYQGMLQKVRQSLARYELGEIAHIENVLKGESKSNELQRLDKTIVTQVSESERESETEKDLKTQDQFSLQTETAKTISDSKSFEAGLTVTGSYGPSLTATATANFSQQNSSEQSTQASSNYAREVVSTSVQKIKERVFSSRTTTNINKVKVINKHELNNAAGADHIRGIYQWVNKIYRLQVVNYGQRTMLEFTIPEPAAFYRFALTKRPNENSTLIKPDLPGYCSRGVFNPLTAADIDSSNYQFWSSKYGATDIKPYPEESKVISWNTSLHVDQSQASGQVLQIKEISKDATQPASIPTNYVVDTVDYNVVIMRSDVGTTEASKGSDQMELSVMIGTKEIMLKSITDNTTTGIDISEWRDKPNSNTVPVYYYSGAEKNVSDFRGQMEALPISIVGFTTLAVAVNVGLKITCSLNPKAREQWQIDTLNSIMSAYNDQKAQYDRDLKALQFDNIASIQGKNPLLNREIEKIELKKSVLAQLTGQNYEYFNSMKYNIPPTGYPQMDLDDADDEGNYIRFFEQAFEWENMTYLFYPYFWAKNSSSLLQLSDNDPLFERFLQAGSARVQLPMRPGFESSISSFIFNGGRPWLHSDAPLPDTDKAKAFVSMIDAIKAQRGFDFNEPNPGTISVTNDSVEITGVLTDFRIPNATQPYGDDENREIIIMGKSYRIQSVKTSTSITLREPYDGETKSGIGYYLGPKFVGEFWEELVPTELVYLNGENPFK